MSSTDEKMREIKESDNKQSETVGSAQGSADAIGKHTVLSGTFIGGPRDKRRRYMDAMALVRKYGKRTSFSPMIYN